jgi:transposase
MKITRIGLDIAKDVFVVHAVDRADKTVLNKRLGRAKVRDFFAQLEPCLVAMESCGGAHYWAREFAGLGHEVRLIAPQFVSPYRRGGKNDDNDACAICEAAGRPDMRFVPVKSVEQQAVLTMHRARALLIGERTALVNQIRGLLAEFGIVVRQGVAALRQVLPDVLEDGENALPAMAREVVAELGERLRDLEARAHEYDRRIALLAKQMPAATRLMQVPGIGPLTATALVASVGDARTFSSGRQFAAWLGLVPKQYSSGGTTRLGRITRRGDRYLRTLLVHGARAQVCHAAKRHDTRGQWIQAVRLRRGFNKATVALAARNARIVWALLARDQDFQPHVLARVA